MALDGPSARSQLNDIADTLRACEREKVWGRTLPRTAVPLLAEAASLGAFSGPECAAVRLALARWRSRGTEPWHEVIGHNEETDPAIITWQCIVNALYPDLADTTELTEDEKEERRRHGLPITEVGKCELHLWTEWQEAARRIATRLLAAAKREEAECPGSVPAEEQNGASITHRKALECVRDELDAWGDFEQSESWTECFPEPIENDRTACREPHPLWLAIRALERFYPKKRLPKLTGALDAWANLCKYSRQHGKEDRIEQRDKAVNAAGRVREWVCAEIERLEPAGAIRGGHADDDREPDRMFMEIAINEATKSVSEDSRVHPKVGVVVVRDGKELARAFRGELSNGEHAEYTALERKLANETVAGATVYTTLEPCTTRNHPKLPCAVRLIERKVRRVVIGMLDPNPRIRGKGLIRLREANIRVGLFLDDLMSRIEDMNREFIRHHKDTTEPAPPESGSGATL